MRNDNMSAKGGSAFGGKDINYWDIFKHAFLMTWKNKFLWFLGLLIFVGTLASSINIDPQVINVYLTTQSPAAQFFQTNAAASNLAIITLLILVMLFFLLRIVASAALVKAVSNISVYRQVSCRSILNEARTFLRPLLLMEIGLIFMTLTVTTLLMLPSAYLFTLHADNLAQVMVIAAFVILLPLGILAYYLQKYATFLVVLGNMPVKLALETAYSIFQKNIKASLKMLGFTILLDIALLAVLVVAIFVIGGIFAGLSFVLLLYKLKFAMLIIIAAGAALLLAMVLSLVSWYTVFILTAWVLFFEHLTLEKKDEKEKEKLKVEGSVPSPEAV